MAVPAFCPIPHTACRRCPELPRLTGRGTWYQGGFSTACVLPSQQGVTSQCLSLRARGLKSKAKGRHCPKSPKGSRSSLTQLGICQWA